MPLGRRVQWTARFRDGIAVPMASYLSHAMVMGQWSAAGQYLIAGTVLDGLEKLDGIGHIRTAESKVEVDAGTGIVGLGYSTRNGIVVNTTFAALLQWSRW